MNLWSLLKVVRATTREGGKSLASPPIGRHQQRPARCGFQPSGSGDASARLPGPVALLRCLGAALIVTALVPSAQGQTSVTLAWDPSPSAGIAGYRLYQGGASRTYTNVISVGLATSNTVSGLRSRSTYYFAVTAYGVNGLESDFSSEISYTVPPPSSAPPAITLAAPADGAVYSEPATITFAANVSSNGHSVTQVQFFNGPMLLSASTVPPYSFSWNNVGAGTYSLSAKVVYDSGATFSSLAATVTVTAARRPSVLSLAADSGSLTAPLVANNRTLSQPLLTGAADGGKAVYIFNIIHGGDYLVSAMVSAPSLGQNSFYVNIDAEPTDPVMIWDIPVCTSLTSSTVSWRGNGNGDPGSAQFVPKVFALSAGMHKLFIRGREANATLGTISIAPTPPKLQIRAVPGGTVTLIAAGQPGQTYSVACSEDLRTWTILGTITLDANGAGKFNDPAGNSQPRRIYRLQATTASPPRLQIQTAAGGSVVLSGTGQSGRTYNVLSSQDLKTWTLSGTVTISTSGSFTFTDPAGKSYPKRFYCLQGQ